MQIQSFRIENYKGFRDSGEIRFGDGFNVIVGQNDVGKTAFTEALALLFEPKPHRSSKTIPVQDIPPPTVSSATIRFQVCADELKDLLITGALPSTLYVPAGDSRQDPAHHLRIAQELVDQGPVVETGRTVEVTGPGASTVSQPDPFLVGYKIRGGELGGNHRTYWKGDVERTTGSVVFHDRTNYSMGNAKDLPARLDSLFRSRLYVFEAVRFGIDENVTGNEPELQSDASNLVQVLHLLSSNPIRWRRYLQHVKAVLPQLQEVTFSPVANRPGTVRALLWNIDPATERDDLAVSLSESGTGVGQVLAMLYVAFASRFPRTIVIDEPQSFLHPGALRKLFEILKSYPQHQYIVTTHSPNAVMAANPSALFLIRKEDEESVVEQLDVSETRDQSRFLREVGSSLSDVFGADDILWVEGTTEEECFPLIMSGVAGRPLLGTKIIGVLSTGDLEGKRSRDVYRIYKKLSESSGLLPPTVGFIFDKEERTKGDRQDLIRESGGLVAFLPRKMYENYLLNPSAIAEVVSDADSFRDNEATAEEVERWIEEHGRGERYSAQASDERLIDDPSWLVEVDSAKLLKDLFDDLSESRISYDKVAHGVALTQWLCQKEPDDLREVAALIQDRLDCGSSSGLEESED